MLDIIQRDHEARGTSLVVIDSINCGRLSMSAALDKFVGSLNIWAKEKGVCVCLSIHNKAKLTESVIRNIGSDSNKCTSKINFSFI